MADREREYLKRKHGTNAHILARISPRNRIFPQPENLVQYTKKPVKRVFMGIPSEYSFRFQSLRGEYRGSVVVDVLVIVG